MEEENCGVPHLEVSPSNRDSLVRSHGWFLRKERSSVAHAHLYHLFEHEIYSKRPDVDSSQPSRSTAKDMATHKEKKKQNPNFTVKKFSSELIIHVGALLWPGLLTTSH